MLRQALAANVWLDVVLPVASLIVTGALAFAALRISNQSHATAKLATKAAEDANKLAVQFHEEEKAQQALAWRRQFAVDLRTSYSKTR